MIYHITNPDLWQRALILTYYKHPSLRTEGFVHCSTKEQLFATAARHFPDETEMLVLLIVEKRVKDQLKWEGVDPANPFPHIYGKFHIEAVEDVRTLLKKSDGSYELV